MHRWNVGSIVVFAVIMVVLCSAAAANMVSAEHEGLLHVLSTDEHTYVLHDSVYIDYSVTNVSGDTMYILLPLVNCPIWIQVFRPSGTLVWSDPPGCVDEAGGAVLLPGEGFSRETIWDMTVGLTGNPIQHPGIYTVEGSIAAFDPIAFAVELEIGILDPTSVPDGTVPTTWSRIKAVSR
jgi:hypothetical protein